MTELVARLRAKQVMLEKLALLLIEHRILKASDLTGITSECREAADAIESQERDKTALAARIAELERDNKNVREELQRRDKIYQSGTVVVTNDKYSELVQRAEKAESALRECREHADAILEMLETRDPTNTWYVATKYRAWKEGMTSDTPKTDEEATRLDGDLPHVNGYVDADFARQLERDLAAANALLDCRAGKLLRKGKPFLVVAIDEPYYSAVYKMIRDREMEIGRWNSEDEVKYRAAIDAIAAKEKPNDRSSG